jgi:hypothetical protein
MLFTKVNSHNAEHYNTFLIQEYPVDAFVLKAI